MAIGINWGEIWNEAIWDTSIWAQEIVLSKGGASPLVYCWMWDKWGAK